MSSTLATAVLITVPVTALIELHKKPPPNDFLSMMYIASIFLTMLVGILHAYLSLCRPIRLSAFATGRFEATAGLSLAFMAALKASLLKITPTMSILAIFAFFWPRLDDYGVFGVESLLTGD